MDFEGNCIMKLSTHRDGQTYTYDHCTNCVCNATTNICQRKVCPPLTCSLTNQITELGECCPKCVETQETVTTCSYKGKEYKSGDNWKHNNCHKCSCLNGQIRCKAETCAKGLICPNRYKLTRLTGDCCHTCVERVMSREPVGVSDGWMSAYVMRSDMN
ncbi:unnamed protein product [Medioppia subpectinata]|uniref:VWFC domain-containing protein n=1 Tax=Medioppia subpectinata TaxID=1979941 RepID=A0A7R9PX68_9ACAR|nr:unnamed protein product [Medioppia subpectinata]CAG2104700.1 unnamed protein product [Medioppia subpectinata]